MTMKETIIIISIVGIILVFVRLYISNYELMTSNKELNSMLNECLLERTKHEKEIDSLNLKVEELIKWESYPNEDEFMQVTVRDSKHYITYRGQELPSLKSTTVKQSLNNAIDRVVEVECVFNCILKET